MDSEQGAAGVAPSTGEGQASATPAGAAPQTRRPWYRRRGPQVGIGSTLVVAGALAFGLPAAANAGAAAAHRVAQAAAAAGAATAQDAWTDQRTYRGAPGWDGAPTDSGTGTEPEATTPEATAATTDESVGVAIIETVLGYQEAAAAGTGIVLTSDGLILTNNHVIDGSTAIAVTLADTGETYAATVVGTAPSEDVAVLQLEDASGLRAATIDDDAEAVGDAITAVGNAEGGGVLLAADGQITDLESSVTTAASGTTAAETLDGMIEIAADVVSGDSGGPVLDAGGEVIGVTTAASSGSVDTTAYAIPIEDALALADQIIAGTDTAEITIGYPAFLGVQLPAQTTVPGGTTAAAGALIAGVVAGTPAAEAGIGQGDTITAVDGQAVADGQALRDLLAGYAPGEQLTIEWIDASGAAQSATVTLIQGAAD
ncbi:S1C family serine protease [Microbacterium sp. JZ31]|uniref:S1C family serine protease n=1 Tax=Microbacterium sp. JZ31 TaxID=1906274 RepID=UPI0019329A83|nr:trypsin-like peptidase domain-containing protein [Microbacterium sp. JZ31]